MCPFSSALQGFSDQRLIQVRQWPWELAFVCFSPAKRTTSGQTLRQSSPLPCNAPSRGRHPPTLFQRLMLGRNGKQDETKAKISESLFVALGTVHESHEDWIQSNAALDERVDQPLKPSQQHGLGQKGHQMEQIRPPFKRLLWKCFNLL